LAGKLEESFSRIKEKKKQEVNALQAIIEEKSEEINQLRQRLKS
jgi:hypothetical protein